MKTRLSLTLLLFCLLGPVRSQAQESTAKEECGECSKKSPVVKQSDDAAIDRMLTRMNSSAGEEKREAITALLNLLVQERQSMQAEIAALRITVEQSSDCQKCCDCCKAIASKEGQAKNKEEKTPPKE